MRRHACNSSIKLLGVNVRAFRGYDALWAEIAKRPSTKLAFANTNLLNRAYEAPGLAAALKDFLVVNDGIGLNIGSGSLQVERSLLI